MNIEVEAVKAQIIDVLESITDGFFSLNSQWQFTYVNQATERLSQKTREELLGRTIWEVYPGLIGSAFDEQLHRAVNEQVVVHFETPSVHAGKWREFHAYPYQDGLSIYWRDITERKQAEEALQRREEELRSLTDTIPALISYVDCDRYFRFVNRAYTDWFGRSAEEIIGRTVEELVGETTYQHMRPLIEAALAGESITAEMWIPFQYGGPRYVRRQYIPDIDAQGNVKGFYALINDLTNLKQAEAERERLLQELEIERARFEALLQQMPAGVIVADAASGHLVLANEKAKQIIGYSYEPSLPIEEYQQVTPFEGFRSDGQPYAPEEHPLARSLRRGEVVTNEEMELRQADGSRVFLSANSAPILDNQQQIVAAVVVFQDVSDRKQAEEVLREREQRFSRLFNGMEDWVLVYHLTPDNQPGRLIEVNEQACRRLGYTRQELLNMSVADIICSPSMNPKAKIEQLLIDKHIIVESIHRTKDGQLLPVEVSATLFTLNGLPTIQAICRDITERKRAEEALRESNERLNLALAAAYMGDWSWDAATDVVTFSQPAAEIFGISPGPYMTWTQMRQLLHEQDRDRTRLAVERAILDHAYYDVEYRVIRPDGVLCWVAAKGLAQYDGSGQVLSMIGVVQDITRRKQAEEALRESEATARARAEELEALMQITPVALWIAHDPNCHYMSANQAAYELMRATPGSVATATPPDGSNPLQFQQRRNGQVVLPHDLPMQRAVRTGQEVTDELEFVFEDGEVRFMYGKAVPLRNETGSIRGTIAAFVDITERKHAEREREQLLARERVAREEAETANRIKDEFLAVLSHELRSPLNPILGWAKLLRSRRFDEQTIARALETIERNAKLQAQLIEDLLDVSRVLRGKLVLNVAPVNLVSTIEAALETMRLAAEAKGIQIQTIFALDVGQVRGDSGRLQQVVWNLLSNSIKFTPAGGQIEVSLEQVGNFAQIQVKDTGQGITPEFLPYVFEYFRQADSATTRKFGGLGLGLAIVRYLTELHGGSVQAESPGEGLGATFTVKLPLMEEVRESDRSDEQDAVTDLKGVRVLVVDDEADMRQLAAFILEESGAEVQVAASAAEALECLDQFQPDILISDIGMPDVDGYMLMRQVRARSPQQGGLLPAIALTAYAGELNQQQAIAAGFQRHLSKPIEPNELVKAIATLIKSVKNNRNVEF